MKNTSVLTFIETKETLMLKLKAAICDDDTKHTQDIASKLEQYDVVHDANISYQAFDKPTELLHLYKTGERFDILFLDIEKHLLTKECFGNIQNKQYIFGYLPLYRALLGVSYLHL